MKRSESIAELATALAAAQVNFGAVGKTGKNPMFKSDYSTFDDIIGAARKPLSDAGLSYVQMLDALDGAPALTTTLMHASGEWIESTTPVVSISGNRGTNEVQAFGSTLTYMKRYALAAMLGMASDEDDDGASAQPRKQPSRPTQRTPAQQNGPPPMNEPPQDADEQGAAEPSAPYLDVVELGVFDVKAGGRPHIGLMAAGNPWPDIRWWKGRDELIEAAPWIGESVTKDDLGEMGVRFPFAARVYYTEDGKGYKVAERFEPLP